MPGWHKTPPRGRVVAIVWYPWTHPYYRVAQWEPGLRTWVESAGTALGADLEWHELPWRDEVATTPALVRKVYAVAQDVKTPADS